MKTKKQAIPFSFYDTAGMERHLEAMAEKGWFLESIGNFFWTYRQDTPKKVHYSAIYYPSASAFEPEPSEGQQTIEDFCDHAGWRCAAANAQLLIFANERENPIPIHTDPQLELETLERMGRRTLWTHFLLIAICLLQCWTSLGQLLHDPIRLLSSSALLTNLLIFPMLGIYFVLETCTWYPWRKKARRAAEQDAPLPPVHGHHRFLLVVLGVTVLGLLYTFLAARLPGYRLLLAGMLAAYTALFLVVNGTRLALKKKKVSTGRNRAITLTVDLLLALVLTGGVTWYIFHAGHGHTAPDAAPPLELGNLLDADTSDYMQVYQEDASFLLRSVQCRLHPPYDTDWSGRPTLDYTIVEIYVPALYDTALHQLHHKYDHLGDHNEDYDPEHPFYEFRPADPAPWGAEQVWQRYSYGEADSVYLLSWADKIVELKPDWFLTETQMFTVGNTFSS